MRPLDVCYIVSHGFAARMILQTNLLGKLVNEGFHVGIISPDKNDSNLKSYCETNNVQLIEFKPKGKTWDENYLFIRKYFLEDIKKNPALLEKHIYSIRGNKSKNPWKRLRPYLFWSIYLSIKPFPYIRKWFKAKEEKYLLSKEAEDFLKNLNPKLLIATYPVSLTESILLNAANKNKLRTVIHLLSWDNISCKGHFAALAEKYITWGPIMSNELREYYNVKVEDIYECGVPHFDEHFEVKKQPEYKDFVNSLGLDGNKPYLFFAMSSPRFAPHEIDIVERLASLINNDHFGDQMQLVVRPHPQNVQGNMADLSWLPRLNNIAGTRVGIDYPELVQSQLPWSMKHSDMKRLSNLLAGATVVINSGSTISIDALRLEKPVIITAFDGDKTLEYWQSAKRLIDFTHLKKLISFNGIKISKNYVELSEHINRYIKTPNADWKERAKADFEECGLNDGKATERVIESIKFTII